MLLRSSSTPVLGSLLPPTPDSPNHNNNHYEGGTNRHCPSSTRLFFHPSPGSLHLSTAASCGSSPVSVSSSVFDQFPDFDRKGFRRAQSEGNLEGIVHAAGDTNQDQLVSISARRKSLGLTLQTIPSFSFYNSKAMCEEEEEVEYDLQKKEEEEEEVMKSSEKRVMALSGGQEIFSLARPENMVLSEEAKAWNSGIEGEGRLIGQEVCVGRGSGGGSRGGGGGGGGGGELNPSNSGGDGSNHHAVEEYYKRMIDKNPGNHLFLGNYAQFLYEIKRELERAEEYYSRAILADPRDGKILSQYAKLLWELHHDQQRASAYFERAVEASPQDSCVHAAYASFLWDTETDEDEFEFDSMPSQFRVPLISPSAAYEQ